MDILYQDHLTKAEDVKGKYPSSFLVVPLLQVSGWLINSQSYNSVQMGNKSHNPIVSSKNFENAEKLVTRRTSTQNSYRMFGCAFSGGEGSGSGLEFKV